MMYTNLALVATLAVGQAFLIPPTISSVDTLSFEHGFEAEARILDLNCPGCPVLASDLGGKPHMLQMENKLRLNFSVAHEEVDKLYLNGLQIHPVDILNPWDHPLTAPQIVRIGSEPSVAAYPKLGFQLSVKELYPFSQADQLHLYALKLDIVVVADKFVNGIDTVELKFLKIASGKLMIGDLEVIPSSKPSSPVQAPHDDGKECTSALCKWRAILADKLSKLKGCGGNVLPGHKTRPKHHGQGGRPHPHGIHRPHHRHHRKHGAFIRIMRSIVLHILIPVTVGIIAGVTASLVGMVVGHFVVFVWRALFRRGSNQRHYSKLQPEEVSEEGDNAQKGLVEHQGPPPVYEDAPAYEEAMVDERAS